MEQPKENYTFEEIAEQLGISTEVLIKLAINEGLLNEDLTPTEFAIREGLLTVRVQTSFSEN